MDFKKKANEILSFFKISPNVLTLSLSFLVFSMYVGGILLSLLVFSLVIYKNHSPRPFVRYQDPNRVVETQVEPVQDEMIASAIEQLVEATLHPTMTQVTPTNTFLPELVFTPTLPQTQGATILETQAPTATITMTPTITRTATITHTPEPLIISSPIQGVEIYELASIISQPYNVPNIFSDSGHHGVDLGSYNFRGHHLMGWPLAAVFEGTVAGVVADRPPVGNVVILETPYEKIPLPYRYNLEIEPGQSLYHMYCHMIDASDFEIGQYLETGDVVGHLGNSQTAEAHLHFEARIGISGLTVGSMAFYDTSATEDEMQTYLWWRTSGEVVPFNPMIIFEGYQ